MSSSHRASRNGALTLWSLRGRGFDTCGMGSSRDEEDVRGSS